jgi:formyltetrahydrofolate-dependent phosphoribosylglycinamide formyltransferase
MPDTDLNLAFFVSGNGSAVRHLHSRLEKTTLPLNISLIVTNNDACGGAQWAREQGFPVAGFGRSFTGDTIDADCLEVLQEHRIDLIILGGFLRQIGPRVLAAFDGQIVNIHPALLPKFGGKGMYGHHVHEAVLAAGENHTGATIHRVDAAYDEGPIIVQHLVRIEAEDTAAVLGNRVIEAEGRLLVYFLDQFRRGRIA